MKYARLFRLLLSWQLAYLTTFAHLTIAVAQTPIWTALPTVSATKKVQRITFGTAPTITVGQTGTVTAQASTNYRVTFSSSTPSICSFSVSQTTPSQTGNISAATGANYATSTTAGVLGNGTGYVTGISGGTCIIKATAPGDVYYYDGQATQNIVIGKASQTVNWGDLPTSLGVGRTNTLAATTTSGLTVSFSSLTPTVCTVSNSKVTSVAAGDCIVAADQAGNGNYNAAPQTTKTFVVPTISLASASRHGVSATITPPLPEVGRSFSLYLGAKLGGYLFIRGAGLQDWNLYQGGAMPVAQQVTSMPPSLPVNVTDLDVSVMQGLEVLLGYGDIDLPDHLATVLSVQKRTTILFPNPASSVYLATYSPLGQGMIVRRDGTGGITSLDIVAADGTYYQLDSAIVGALSTGGYTVTPLSLDANSNVTQISITEPNGDVSTFGSPVISSRSNLVNQRSSIVDQTCNNPDGSQGIADAQFPKTTACHIVMTHGHPTFEVVRKVVEKANRFMDTVGRYSDQAAKFLGFNSGTNVVDVAEDETATVATDLANWQRIDSSQHTVYASDEVITQNGTHENSAKAIIDNLTKIRQNASGTNAAAFDRSQLKGLDGSWIFPLDCGAKKQTLDNKTCVPICDPGTELSGASCVSVCKQPGQTWFKDTCTAVPVCAADKYVQTSTNTCVARCKAPAVWVSSLTGPSSCVTPTPTLTCEAGSEVFSGSCFNPATMACPPTAQECTTYTSIVTGKPTTTCKAPSPRPVSCSGVADGVVPKPSTGIGSTPTPTTGSCSANDSGLIGRWSRPTGYSDGSVYPLSFDAGTYTSGPNPITGCQGTFSYSACGGKMTTRLLSSNCGTVGTTGSTTYSVNGSRLTFAGDSYTKR